jgi:hypothetical protein
MLALRAALASATLFAATASAGDGRIEINQARALAGGVTPGDAAGFPVTLSQPGSYVLTGPLSGMNANTSAISITSSFVTLDLNGFDIVGPTTCTGEGDAIACAPLGSGRGIDASSAGIGALAIRNGTIRGMGAEGVFIDGTGVLLHGLTLVGNGAAGSTTDGDAVISSCAALRNNARGFLNGGGTVVVDSIADANGSDGINAGQASVVHRSASNNNGGAGIRVFGGSVVAQNVANDNAVALSAGSDSVAYGGNNFDDPALGGSGAAVLVSPNLCGPDSVCP